MPKNNKKTKRGKGRVVRDLDLKASIKGGTGCGPPPAPPRPIPITYPL